MLKLNISILALISSLIIGCQTSPFADCKSVSLKSSNKAVPFYKSEEMKNKNIGGYISTGAKIDVVSGCSDTSQEIVVKSGSSLAGSKVWVASANIFCKK